MTDSSRVPSLKACVIERIVHYSASVFVGSEMRAQIRHRLNTDLQLCLLRALRMHRGKLSHSGVAEALVCDDDEDGNREARLDAVTPLLQVCELASHKRCNMSFDGTRAMPESWSCGDHPEWAAVQCTRSSSVASLQSHALDQDKVTLTVRLFTGRSLAFTLVVGHPPLPQRRNTLVLDHDDSDTPHHKSASWFAQLSMSVDNFTTRSRIVFFRLNELLAGSTAVIQPLYNLESGYASYYARSVRDGGVWFSHVPAVAQFWPSTYHVLVLPRLSGGTSAAKQAEYCVRFSAKSVPDNTDSLFWYRLMYRLIERLCLADCASPDALLTRLGALAHRLNRSTLCFGDALRPAVPCALEVKVWRSKAAAECLVDEWDLWPPMWRDT